LNIYKRVPTNLRPLRGRGDFRSFCSIGTVGGFDGKYILPIILLKSQNHPQPTQFRYDSPTSKPSLKTFSKQPPILPVNMAAAIVKQLVEA